MPNLPWWKLLLNWFGAGFSSPSVSGLVTALCQGRPKRRWQAVEALAELAEESWHSVCSGLCRALLVDQPKDVWEAILAILIKHRATPDASARLREAINDKNAKGGDRLRALQALMALELPAGHPLLGKFKHLSDPRAALNRLRQADAAGEQAQRQRQEKARAESAARDEAARGPRCPGCGSTRRVRGNSYDGFTDAYVGWSISCADCHRILESHD